VTETTDSFHQQWLDVLDSTPLSRLVVGLVG
jgi:hypothetical protein